MFEGSDYGYARFSIAAPTDLTTNNLKPAIAIKLLRDGLDSANLVAMFSVAG